MWRIFFLSKIVKNLASRTYAIQEPNREEIVATFNRIKLQKTNQTESRVETVIKEEGNRSSVKERVIITHLIAEQMKKILSYKMGFYLEPYNYGKNKMKVELDLSNHPAKLDLKKATSIDISKFAKKSDLANL